MTRRTCILLVVAFGMGKLRFIEATAVYQPLLDPKLLKSVACIEALSKFEENKHLALGLLALPGFAFDAASRWMEASEWAKNQILGRKAKPEQIQKHAQKIGPLMEQRMAILMERPPEKQKEVLTASTIMFEDFAERSGPTIYGPLTNLLRSVIVQSWLAFEVLSEDLWLGVMKENPTLLTKPKQVRFRSRKGIREAYTETFTADNTALIAALSNTAIDALALVRNVIVHKAGKADRDFLAGCQTTPSLSSFSTLNLEDSIFVDGVLFRSIVADGLKAVYGLIVAVDDWLRAHITP